MFDATRTGIAVLLALLAGFGAGAPAATALGGTLRGEDGSPVTGAYVALTSAQWAGIDSSVVAGDGKFALSADAPEGGHLVIQPPAREVLPGLKTFAHTPRLYNLEGGEISLDLRLPECGTVVLLAPNGQGGLMRFGDFARLAGESAPFVYVTDLDWNALPAAVWHVFGPRIGQERGPREEGLPAVCVAPGEPFVVWLLFWKTGYGKLALRMDNAGRGFLLGKAGDALALQVNEELARTAVHDLESNRARYGEGSGPQIRALAESLAEGLAKDGNERDSACAAVLENAVRLRDVLELAYARNEGPKIRQGTLDIVVRDAAGEPVPGAKFEITQKESHFRFGLFEGNPYDPQDFARFREAGFNMGTVLPAWGWSGSPKTKRDTIDRALGISAMAQAGLGLKAHGVVWFQEYGILPKEAMNLSHDELVTRVLTQQQSLLDVFGSRIGLWEAINEPAHTNIVGLPREMMIDVLAKAAAQIHGAGKTALVNSPHEFSYGAFGQFFGTDNRPVDDYPLTYAVFLDLAAKAGALDDIDVIGIQYYPGFRLGGGFAEVEGPAFPPSYVCDLLDRYARFGKTLHITEFSLPSEYKTPTWNTGYWREPWNETTQADYAEAVYTIAFAHPSARSVTWWDIRDTGAAIQYGGLLHEDGSPKPAFERIAGLLAGWRTEATVETDATGHATLPAYGGEYAIHGTLPEGVPIETEVTVIERFINTLEIGAEE